MNKEELLKAVDNLVKLGRVSLAAETDAYNCMHHQDWLKREKAMKEYDAARKEFEAKLK